MRKILLLALLLFPISISAQSLFIHPKISNAYQGTCAITTGNCFIGTGVLLDSGYIVTAAHVVDHNNDKLLDDTEKKVKVYFFSKHLPVDCNVVAFGDITKTEPDGVFLDIAVLEPSVKIRSKLKLRESPALIGTPIFTIGMTLGGPPAITSGHINFPLNKYFGRTSAPIYSGNSGGGVFDSETQECVGFIISVAGRKIPIRLGPYITFIYQPIFHLSQYIPSYRVTKVIRYLKRKAKEKHYF